MILTSSSCQSLVRSRLNLGSRSHCSNSHSQNLARLEGLECRRCSPVVDFFVPVSLPEASSPAVLSSHFPLSILNCPPFLNWDNRGKPKIRNRLLAVPRRNSSTLVLLSSLSPTSRSYSQPQAPFNISAATVDQKNRYNPILNIDFTQSRNGSNVPGPLEANRRLAKRKMGAMVASGHEPQTLSDLGLGLVSGLNLWNTPWANVQWQPPKVNLWSNQSQLVGHSISALPKPEPNLYTSHGRDLPPVSAPTAQPNSSVLAAATDDRFDLFRDQIVAGLSQVESFVDICNLRENLCGTHSQLLSSSYWALVVEALKSTGRLLDVSVNAIVGSHINRDDLLCAFFQELRLHLSDFRLHDFVDQSRDRIGSLILDDQVLVDEQLLRSIRLFVQSISPGSELDLLHSQFHRAVWIAIQGKGEHLVSQVAGLLLESIQKIDFAVRFSSSRKPCCQLILELYSHFWPSPVSPLPDQFSRTIVRWFINLDAHASQPASLSAPTLPFIPLCEQKLAEVIVQISSDVKDTLPKLTDRMLRLLNLKGPHPKLRTIFRTDAFRRWLRLLRSVTEVYDRVKAEGTAVDTRDPDLEWDTVWDGVYRQLAQRVDVVNISDHFAVMSDQHFCDAMLNHWGPRHLQKERRDELTSQVKAKFCQKQVTGLLSTVAREDGYIGVGAPTVTVSPTIAPLADYVHLVEAFNEAGEGRYRRVLKDVFDIVVRKYGVDAMFELDFFLRARGLEVYPSVVARALTHGDIALGKEREQVGEGAFRTGDGGAGGAGSWTSTHLFTDSLWHRYISLHIAKGSPPAFMFKLLQFTTPHDFHTDLSSLSHASVPVGENDGYAADKIGTRCSRLRRRRDQLSRQRTELLHYLAWCFATNKTQSPATCFRQVHICYQYLRVRKAEIMPLMSRSLVMAGIIRPLMLSSVKIEKKLLDYKLTFEAAAQLVSPILSSPIQGRNRLLAKLREYRLEQIRRHGEYGVGPISCASAGDNAAVDCGGIRIDSGDGNKVVEYTCEGDYFDLNEALPKSTIPRNRLKFILPVVAAVEGTRTANKLATLVLKWRSLAQSAAVRNRKFDRLRGHATGTGSTAELRERLRKRMIPETITVAVPKLRNGNLVKDKQGGWEHKLWRTKVLIRPEQD